LSLIVNGRRACRRAAGTGDGVGVADGDLGQDVQDVLGAAVGGAPGVLDYVGGQGELLAEGAGALDFHVQDRADRVGAYQGLRPCGLRAAHGESMSRGLESDSRGSPGPPMAASKALFLFKTEFLQVTAGIVFPAGEAVCASNSCV
jgi:hypothetical protein